VAVAKGVRIGADRNRKNIGVSGSPSSVAKGVRIGADRNHVVLIRDGTIVAKGVRIGADRNQDRLGLDVGSQRA